MDVRLWRCNRASDFWVWLVELYSFLYSGVGWKTEGRQASVPELYWGRDMALREGPHCGAVMWSLGAHLRGPSLVLILEGG